MREAGTSVIDVRDPSRPMFVTRIPAAPNTHAHKVQIQGDLMLTNRELIPRRSPPHEAGLAVHDVSDPTRPKRVGWWGCAGKGVHRPTWWQGPLAYVSATGEEADDHHLVVIDLSDPDQPEAIGRWWYPGQGHGEARDWDEGWRVRLHHAIVRDGLAWCGWWDKGLVVLDVADPTAPRQVGGLELDHAVSRATHTFCPLPGRDIAVTTEERIPEGCVGVTPRARLVDIADPARPRVMATFPEPAGDWCERGGRFGPHNIHEPKPDALIDGETVYMTWFNAGLRVYDVADPARPTEIAAFVADPPEGQAAAQANDVLVAPDGLIYLTDRLAGGLHILELTAGAQAARPRRVDAGARAA
jgi:hypothetical protein